MHLYLFFSDKDSGRVFPIFGLNLKMRQECQFYMKVLDSNGEMYKISSLRT